MKYAIKVCLDGKDDWMYITEPTNSSMSLHQSDLVPIIFEDEESAEKIAIIWRLEGKEDNVKVVEYES